MNSKIKEGKVNPKGIKKIWVDKLIARGSIPMWGMVVAAEEGIWRRLWTRLGKFLLRKLWGMEGSTGKEEAIYVQAPQKPKIKLFGITLDDAADDEEVPILRVGKAYYPRKGEN